MIQPVRHSVAQMTEKQELSEAIEEMIPALAQTCGGKLNVILRGSDAAFKKAKDIFLDQMEDHLRACMTKLYAPDQIARRVKSIDSQFSQNMVNPDSQKAGKDMMSFMASALKGPII